MAFDPALNPNNPIGGIPSLATTASNIRVGDNPPYLLDDFYLEYPVYAPRAVPAIPPATGTITTYLIKPAILQMYINLANASIKEARWHDTWHTAMGWFVAHFATLYLQGMADANSTAAQVIAKGQTKGLMSSKSVGDVSVSYDFNAIAQDLEGWASWKLTIYGQQLATFGKMIGKGGMYVW
jgi:hypothetical protein